MILSHDALMKLVHDTKAVSIWNQQTGPVFWYTAGVPGPFFVNTEYLIGAELAKKLVDKITDILAKMSDPASRAAKIKEAVLTSYSQSPDYKNIIDTLVAKAKEDLPSDAFTLISGGERRDWLFSIPFAEQTGLRHVYIFKNQSIFCESEYRPSDKALHVADLINNAASYVEKWLPALKKAQIQIDTTLVVTTRGKTGIDLLKENSVKTLALYGIELPFFEKWLKNGLINQATYNELALHFESAKAWGEKYLMGREDLFKASNDNPKTGERIKSFFTKDPWNLSENHAEFFNKIRSTLI